MARLDIDGLERRLDGSSRRTRAPAWAAALACGLYAMAASGPVRAQCVVCDELVTMNDRLKKCFVEGYESFAASLARSGKPYEVIDMSSCAGVSGNADNERALGGLPTLPLGAAPRIKTRYTLDLRGMACLRDLVTSRAGSFDPRVQFDLLAQCK